MAVAKKSTVTWSHTLKLKSFDLLLHQNTDRKRSTSLVTGGQSSDVFPMCKLFPHLPFPPIPESVMFSHTLKRPDTAICFYQSLMIRW